MLVKIRVGVYNIYIWNFWSVSYWHFYITTSKIGEKYCAINLQCNGMFSALCVLAIITVISRVYTHDQAMVKTACPGGVNTLLYLKLLIYFITFYTQQVSLPCTTRLSVVFGDQVYILQTRSRYYRQWMKKICEKRKQTEQKFQMNKHGFVFIVCDFSITNYVKTFDLRHPKESFVWPVSNQIVVGGA